MRKQLEKSYIGKLTKSEAIEFAKWMYKRQFCPTVNNSGKWFSMKKDEWDQFGDTTYYTSDELYELFKSEKK